MTTVLRTFALTSADGRTATLREARSADFDRYLDAVRRVIAERPRTLVVQEEDLWGHDDFVRNLLPWSERGARLVLESEGEIRGNLSIHRRGSMRANQHVASFGIFLTPEVRGTGLGRQMLEVLELWAREHEVSRIEMPVFAHNERAQRLYRSMGFEVEGYERRALLFPEGPVDEIRMAKLL